jgi:hypothetical protein
MHLLYLDDAGSAANPSEEYFVLAGVSVFESQTNWFTQELDRTIGTQWGIIRNLADTPFFVDSHASRLVQLADHVAYAIFRRYNARDTQYFDIFASKFDSVDNVIHGLAHKQTVEPMCMCPGCLSRRVAQSVRISSPENNI